MARRQFTARYAHPRTPITERYQRRSREPEQSRYGRTPPGRLPSPRAPQSRAGFSAGTGVPPPGRPCAAPHRGDPRPTAPTGDGLRAPSRSNPGTGNPQPPHRSPARGATGGPAREGRCGRGSSKLKNNGFSNFFTSCHLCKANAYSKQRTLITTLEMPHFRDSIRWLKIRQMAKVAK